MTENNIRQILHAQGQENLHFLLSKFEFLDPMKMKKGKGGTCICSE